MKEERKLFCSIKTTFNNNDKDDNNKDNNNDNNDYDNNNNNNNNNATSNPIGDIYYALEPKKENKEKETKTHFFAFVTISLSHGLTELGRFRV